MKREIWQLLRDVSRGEIGPVISKRAQELIDGKEPPGIRRRPEQLGSAYAFAKARHEQLNEEEDQAKRRMREEVFRWNLINTAELGAPYGRCDCGCGYAFRHADEGECDHWIPRSQGGKHTRENGWRLRHWCHEDKTRERPSRLIWNSRRLAYCMAAGVAHMPRRVR